MSAKTTQDLQQRSDAGMASVPTSRQTASARTKRLAARQVSIRCERQWERQRYPKAAAHLATERRARQTERCPAYSENKLCRGKPHGRRQGGKDLASDRGRCATLRKRREARNVTGRRLNKPLSTGSKRTLGVERSQRKFARTWRNFGHGEQGSAGQRPQSSIRRRGKKPQEGTSLDDQRLAQGLKYEQLGSAERLRANSHCLAGRPRPNLFGCKLGQPAQTRECTQERELT